MCLAKSRSLISKGRSFQKKIKDMIQKAFKLDDDDIRTPVGAETGEDIKLSKKGRKIVGLSIECKNTKSINIWKALDQAKSNTPEDAVPAVVFHRSKPGNRDIWVAVPIEHYLYERTGWKP